MREHSAHEQEERAEVEKAHIRPSPVREGGSKWRNTRPTSRKRGLRRKWLISGTVQCERLDPSETNTRPTSKKRGAEMGMDPSSYNRPRKSNLDAIHQGGSVQTLHGRAGGSAGLSRMSKWIREGLRRTTRPDGEEAIGPPPGEATE